MQNITDTFAYLAHLFLSCPLFQSIEKAVSVSLIPTWIILKAVGLGPVQCNRLGIC